MAITGILKDDSLGGVVQLQEGNQAIHIAGAAGQLHILKELVDEYHVPPDTTNTVGSHSYDIVFAIIMAMITLWIIHMHSGWIAAPSHGSKEWTYPCS